MSCAGEGLGNYFLEKCIGGVASRCSIVLSMGVSIDAFGTVYVQTADVLYFLHFNSVRQDRMLLPAPGGQQADDKDSSLHGVLCILYFNYSVSLAGYLVTHVRYQVTVSCWHQR